MTAPTNADVLEAIECAAICLENWGEIHEARDLRAAVAAIIEENNALREDAEAFRWLETHVTLAHRPDADRPMVIINPRFRDRDGDLCSLCVTQQDGVGTVSLSTMVCVLRDAETAARCKGGA